MRLEPDVATPFALFALCSIIPGSGLPMLFGGNTVYAEVEALQRLRTYKTSMAGSCRVVLHPLQAAHLRRSQPHVPPCQPIRGELLNV